jgi:hypothetical protein
MEEILKLLAIKDENGDFVIDASEVAKAQNKSLNAVYTSRKGSCKLDKLTAFDKVRGLIEKSELQKVSIVGDKAGLIDGLSGVLKDGTKYEINYKEV